MLFLNFILTTCLTTYIILAYGNNAYRQTTRYTLNLSYKIGIGETSLMWYYCLVRRIWNLRTLL
jgi:hypothetical protein